MKTFTVEDVMKLNPCSNYNRRKVEELWDGRESLSYDEIMKLDIPDIHIVWFLKKSGYNGAFEWSDGTKVWYKDGELHRDNDLPAVEWWNGTKVWSKNGTRHRENNLPAIEYANGSKEWWFNGQRHRDGGLPAIEDSNGLKEWWVNDKFVRNES